MRSYGEELVERGRQQGLAQGLAQGREQGLAQGWEQGREQGREQGLAQGRLQARAEAVLRILAARGVLVGDEAQQHILACTDMATLDRWFDRALNATTLSDVLEDPAS